MRPILYAALLAPVCCAFLALKTGKYPWNIPITLSCAVIVLLTGRGAQVYPLAIALCLSVVADWFMAHRAGQDINYLLGISGFFLAHCAFLWYASARFAGKPWIYAAFAALVLLYGLYLAKAVLPATQNPSMRIAVCLYALISVASVSLALGMKAPPLEFFLYLAAILLLAFSDTLISLCDFAGKQSVQKWILPTYYACHILAAASAVAGMR